MIHLSHPIHRTYIIKLPPEPGKYTPPSPRKMLHCPAQFLHEGATPWARACRPPCLFLAIIKERYEENFGYQYMCNSPAAPSPQSSISDPFSWAIIHSPRPILRLIRWCSIRRVLWWPEQPSSAKSFHLTHPMWLWYMKMTYSCSDAQGGSGNAKSSKKNAQSTRLGELHIWGTPPLTRSFIMAENRQGAYGLCP